MKFTTRYSAELLTVQEDQYRNPFYGDGFAFGGDGFSSYRRIFNWTWTNLLDYRINLNKDGDMYLNLQLGQESQKLNNYCCRQAGKVFPALYN